ncbi:hypothetical protein UFOVP1279_44 [uncultured Caudovirales phage]|uniref:Uncharacterized protein n=1 Tax=uncultured Caudovirales phage TaxID=2100421 RepID=A0A6J5RN63_9CAUD|nr:hypothetical protein UFOVP1279_44 [uncultured Caudovirales phage]
MSYSGDPSASPLDEVRFIIGDTNSLDEKLTDDEIDYLLTKWVDPMKTAHAAAMSLVALYTGKMNKSIGSTSVDYSQLMQQYQSLASSIARRGGFSTVAMTAIPLAGGLRSVDNPDVLDIVWKNTKEP